MVSEVRAEPFRWRREGCEQPCVEHQSQLWHQISHYRLHLTVHQKIDIADRVTEFWYQLCYVHVNC
jgi:hypothetical protein